jgi:hypothetical protein
MGMKQDRRQAKSRNALRHDATVIGSQALTGKYEAVNDNRLIDRAAA